MSCIITYKGNKYTQEQFKEYISSNKNEFSHIIASNKNVIDSFKRKMEGIDYVFSQSPELASIGSKIQYLQYLSTIFKTSKVKDIVYHGSREAQQILLNGFKIKQTKYKDSIINRPIWFGTEKEFSENSYSYGNTLLFNIINTIKTFNPKIISEQEKNNFVNKVVEKIGGKENNIRYDFFEIEPVWHFYTPEILNILKELGYDSFIEYEGWREDILKSYENIAVFEPEQIHVLSSKKDLEMFKNFVNFTKSEYAKYGDIQQFRDYIMSKNFAAIEEFLVVNNKIDRKC